MKCQGIIYGPRPGDKVRVGKLTFTVVSIGERSAIFLAQDKNMRLHYLPKNKIVRIL